MATAQRVTGAMRTTAEAVAILTESLSTSGKRPTAKDIAKKIGGALHGGSNEAFEAALRDSALGWDTGRCSGGAGGMAFSSDRLSVWKERGLGEESTAGGAVGTMLVDSGRHAFGFRVESPVDDAFWVGAAYADAWVDREPKQNDKVIAFSGGNVKSGRPGTLRVHGEKMRNQRQFSDGDVVVVVADGDNGDLEFYINGQVAASWKSVLKGPVLPYISIKHADGPAATLLQFWEPIAAPTEDADGGGCATGCGITLNGAPSTAERVGSVRDVVGAEPLPLVDGSILEGGGQVLRVALAFGALLGRPLHVHSIRAGRSKPGLGHQHSTGAKLVADICNGILRPEALQFGGHCEGATDLYMWPGVSGLRGGKFHADPHTAGSVTLLLQAALPCAIMGRHAQPIEMVLRGGTNVKGSPPADYIRMVLFPLLVRWFRVPQESLSFEIVRRGFYPWGKGEVKVRIAPAGAITAPVVLDRGIPASIEGVVYAGGTGRRVLKDAASKARQLLRDRFGDSIAIIVSVATEQDGSTEEEQEKHQQQQQPKPRSRSPTSRKAPPQKSKEDDERGLTFKERRALVEDHRKKVSGTAGMQLVLHTTTGCIIAGDSLLESTNTIVSADDVAGEAVARLTEAWDAGGCVCEHTMDQLLIFMSLATGRSRILCPRVSSISSQHVPTAIHFSQLLCGVHFEGLTKDRSSPCVVECDGIGFGMQSNK